MKTTRLIFCLSISTLLSFSTVAYDKAMAEHFSKLFSGIKGADASKALHYVSAETFVQDLKVKKDLLVIDVRTPAETELISMAIPNSIEIPANEIFDAKNLDRIPTDKPVFIVCKSGARATAVGTSLRHLGFDNVFILNGGFQGLSTYYGTVQAYE